MDPQIKCFSVFMPFKVYVHCVLCVLDCVRVCVCEGERDIEGKREKKWLSLCIHVGIFKQLCVQVNSGIISWDTGCVSDSCCMQLNLWQLNL